METNFVSEVCASMPPCFANSTYPARYFLPRLSNSDSNEVSTGNYTDELAGKKPCALVVDDVEDVTEMLSVFLYHAGYDVTIADSAPAAIAAAEARRFDVVVSDIGMPEMNGYQLAAELRKLPGYSTVPMIAVTGFSMYDDQQRSLQSGFNAHLTKPIDPVNLFELIEQLRG